MQAYHAALLLLSLVGLYMASFSVALVAYPLPIGLLGALITFSLMQTCKTKRISIVLLSLVLYCLYAVLGWAGGVNQPSYGYPVQHITEIEGTLVEDSLLTRSNKQLARIALNCCTSKEGYRATCKGTVSALIAVDEVLASGSQLRLKGHLDLQSGLFIADSLQVMYLSMLARLRLYFLRLLSARIQQVISDEATQNLATMLLLGQTGQAGFLLKDVSLACGCSHLLALSGMHLHFFLSLSSRISIVLFGRFWGKRVGSIPAILYVVLVGPKPSLVRALGMHLCSLLPISRIAAFQLTFFLQLLLFPYSLSSLACLYSWAAYSMLLLAAFLPKFPLQNTAIIIAGTGPASLLMNGSCNLAGLFFSPILTPVINVAMAFSFLSLVFGSFFGKILTLVQDLLQRVLSTNQGYAMQVGLLGYGVYILVLLTCLVSIGYATKAVQKRRRSHYELDIRIRLPDSNHCSAQGRGALDVQEIWSELPDLPSSEGEDSSTIGCPTGTDGLGSGTGDRSDHQPAS